jgi:iron-sulfur cluster assembly accessory protein
MNYAKKEDLTDPKTKHEVVKAEDLYVLVDPKAIFYLVGTVMDFEETELSTQFTFNNPNVKGECGCKESFTV